MESMPLAVGQALLDFVVASRAELRSVSDVNRHMTGSTSEVGEAGLGVQTVDTGLVFEYLLREELAFERDLSERRNLVDVPLRNGLVFETDEHGHVSCHVGAIVDKEDGRGFSIVFDPPLVDRLVGGDGQRPLADRVRVCSYLVRLSCKAVVLLEGAGGLMVPLTDELLTIDYIAQKGYPLLFVTSGKLGSINHTLLSLEAIKNRGIKLDTVLYNLYPTVEDRTIQEDTQLFIQRYLKKDFPETKFCMVPEL